MEEEKARRSLSKRILLYLLKSPVNFLLGLLTLYYGLRVFVFSADTLTYKFNLVFVVLLWILWFFAKTFFKIFLLLLVIGMGFYGCYQYNHREKAACEKSGGVWNAQTRICEQKLSWWDKILNYLKPEAETAAKPETPASAPEKEA